MNREENGGVAAKRISKVNKKAAIISAAIEIFLSRGYAALGLRQVAKEMDLSLGAIQYYFKTKEDLFEETFAGLDAIYSVSIRGKSVDKSGLPAEARFFILMSQMFDDISSPNKTRWIFEVWALAQRDARIAKMLNGAYWDWTSLITSLLSEMHPDWTQLKCETTAALAMALLDGVTVLTRPGGVGHPDLQTIKAACMASWRVLIS